MKSYDIIERTIAYAVTVIKLASFLPKSPAGYAFASQIIRSGTSIGANISEAQDAISKKEFVRIMTISLKETRETLYWLTVIERSSLLDTQKVQPLYREGSEIRAILNAIIKKSQISL
jgi:four helix bundle protein